jgi:hypothetical protein
MRLIQSLILGAMMHGLSLWIATMIVPLLWGCGVHWALSRLWPPNHAAGPFKEPNRGTSHPADFQI